MGSFILHFPFIPFIIIFLGFYIGWCISKDIASLNFRKLLCIFRLGSTVVLYAFYAFLTMYFEGSIYILDLPLKDTSNNV